MLLLLFFFLGKGHAQAALSLWNNMLEPVGGKQWFWHMGEEFKCPTEKYPYIFTNKNSAEALKEYKSSTAAATTGRAVTDSSTGASSPASSTGNHRHHKHHKSDSDSFSKKHLAAAAFFIILLILLIVGLSRRQQIHLFVHGTGRRPINGLNNPQYQDDDDVEIWNRSNIKSGYSLNNDIPKTHGTRISFE